ncbi:unnamed protein product [Phytophthora fragariaefolia]|uniref:Unnamed protein product n=1 Tax=Phytophthora fragariaefolia TaxID=1490495 RepID=A0A9W6TII4_9STRA|nr:unnamed protein product [Phytophthora fragariaefolia]
MVGSTSSVQTLIDQFELMAQTNGVPAAPRSWSVAGSKKAELPPQPKSHNSTVNGGSSSIGKQRPRTQSAPVQMLLETEEIPEVDEPAEEPEQESEEEIESKPVTPAKPAVYRNLTIKTLESDDDDDTKTLNSYEGESDADSTAKSTSYTIVPRSPSSFSTASTGSLDSLLSSLDMFLPECLQASRETSSDISKLVKPTVCHSRRSSLPENLQSIKNPKLIPPTSYRRASLTGKSSSSITKETGIPTLPKSRRSSLYTAKDAASVSSTQAIPRRASLSSVVAPPTARSTRRFSESARGAPAVVASPRATRSNAMSLPRYMDYDSSPRFAATKARNLERRRQLEERNRNLTADKCKYAASKTPRRPRTPEWQGRLDQVRSRLFDDNLSRAAKTTTTRRQSTSRV